MDPFPFLGHTHLEDEEAVVVQINALAFEQLRHLREVAAPAIDEVVGLVAAVRGSGHHEIGARNHLEFIIVLVVWRKVEDVGLSRLWGG